MRYRKISWAGQANVYKSPVSLWNFENDAISPLEILKSDTFLLIILKCFISSYGLFMSTCIVTKMCSFTRQC